MDGWVTIGTKLDTKSFDAQLEDLENKLDTLSQEYEVAMADADFPEEELIKYRKEIEQTTNKIITLNKKQMELSKSNVFGDIGKSLKGIIKNVAKWSLAIIGIRSVYLGIRQAMSTLTQYDDQLRANIDYMKFAIANTLKPVIEWIVKALYEILSTMGRIIYLTSGYNIFKNSGIKDYEKAMKKSEGSAKEIKKTLAGFDEMNILSDTKTGGGGSSFVTPDMPDLSEAVDKTSVLEKTVWKLNDAWHSVGEEMGKALSNPQVFQKAFGVWGKAIEGITRMFYGLYEAIEGITDVVSGVILIVQGIVEGNYELFAEGFKKFWEGIKKIFIGFANSIVGIIQTLWGTIIGILGTILQWIDDNFIKPLINGIKIGIENIKTKVKSIVDWAKTKVIEPLITNFNNLKTKVGSVFTGIYDKASSIFGKIKTYIIDKVIEPVVKKFSDFKTSITGTFTSLGNVFRTIGNIFIDAINTIIKGLNKISVKVPDWVPKYGGKKWGFDIREIPRLERGGIVHNPGPGVMMGSYVAGEGKYPEAVLPLDDNTMDRLGEAIARHMTINANITNNMNGRVISRELQKINAENIFAFNS